jgi:hypothetical protein
MCYPPLGKLSTSFIIMLAMNKFLLQVKLVLLYKKKKIPFQKKEIDVMS